MDVPTELFREHQVELAYLFGSQARGRAGPDSDVDLAVLFPAELTPVERLERAGRLQAALQGLLGRAVDLVTLNDAGPALCFEAVIRGRNLARTSVEDMFFFEQRVRGRYEDLVHSQRFFTEARRRRLGLTS